MFTQWLCAALFLLPCFLFGKIYDAFLFFNEEEVLRIHLEELYDHVDGFILVEATQTFSGNQKELLFPKIRDSYEKYLDKITYIPVTEQISGSNPWTREEYQRNQIMRGLTKCQREDIIIISDADEIVRAEELPFIIDELQRIKVPVIGCDCDFYRWFLNRRDETQLIGPAVTRYGYLVETSPQKARGNRFSYIYEKAAWHFSNMGGLSFFLDKIRNFSHFAECNPDAIEQDPHHLYLSIQKFSLVEIDETFPRYVQENKEMYREKHFIDTEEGSYY